MADSNILEITNLSGGITDEYLDQDHRFVELGENVCLDASADIVQRPGSHFMESSLASSDTTSDMSGVTNNVGHVASAYLPQSNKTFVALVENTAPKVAIKSIDSSNTIASVGSVHTVGCFTMNNCSSRAWQGQMFVSDIGFSKPVFKVTEKGTDTNPTNMYPITAGLPKPIVKYGNQYDGYQFNLSYWKGRWKPGVLGFAGEINSYANAELSLSPVNANSRTYAYTFVVVAKRKYIVDGIEYLDVSAPSDPMYFYTDTELGRDVSPFADGDATVIIHFWLPPGMYSGNSALENRYEFANTDQTSDGNIFLEVYRTVNGGTIFYQANTSSNPTFSPIYNTEDIKNPCKLRTKAYMDSALNNTINGGLGWAGGDGYFFINYSSDAEIVQNPTLYTTGGILPNDEPPKAKFIHLHDAYMYYGYTADVLESHNSYTFPTPVPNRIKQAVANDPDSVPSGNYIDLDGPVTGISSAGEHVIATTLNSVFRIDGRYDEFGRGVVVATKISAETGCIAHNSMVIVGDKCYFCGIDGWYVTNGSSVEYISKHLRKTYNRLVSTASLQTGGADNRAITYGYRMSVVEQQTISGVYDRIRNRVMWSFLDGTEVYALELSQPISQRSCFFGPWRNGIDPQLYSTEACYALFLTKIGDRVIRTDKYKQVYELSTAYSSDPRIYPNSSENYLRAMDRYPILYRIRTVPSFLGSSFLRKMATWCSLTFKRSLDEFFHDISGMDKNLDVRLTSINDKGTFIKDMKPVHHNSSLEGTTAEGVEFKLGSYASLATAPGAIEQSSNSSYMKRRDSTNPLITVKRRFPAGGLRCMTKQVEVKAGLKEVYTSIGTALEAIEGNNPQYGLLLDPSGMSASLVKPGGNTTVFSTGDFNPSGGTSNAGLMQAQDTRVLGYYLAISYDDYKAIYPVASISGNGESITFSAPITYQGGSVPLAINTVTTLYNFKLYTIPKGQYFGLCGMNIGYTTLTPNQAPYQPGSTGEP